MKTIEYNISQLIDEGKVTIIHAGKMGYREENATSILLDNTIYSLDCYLFLLVEAGSVEINLNNHPNKLYDNSVLMLKPYTPIIRFNPSSDYKAKIILINRTYFEQTEESNRFHGLQNRLIATNGMAALTLDRQETREIVQVWNMLVTMPNAMQTYINEGFEYVLNFIQLQMADIMFRAVAQKQPKMIHKDRLFQDFLKLLSTYYEQQHNILFYAKHLGVTPTYLSRIVREISGKTVHTYIMERLYTAARHLLSSTDCTVSEIAYRLHFSDQSAFGKFFKSHAQISPLKYRNAQK